MHCYTIAIIFLGVLSAFMISTASASVISCPPSNLQETSPYLRQLCYAIEQAISENAPPQEQYNLGGNAKRQDVDHVFLRFGRRMGL
ncbi:hypothetical protein HHI36_023692 [Cryptolaemus montrouzieri]|uniref:Myosuppressin n=1 Tax=Cryptolaemus montrouzieri TaxID=559131 RepID=A0ABD2PHT0_9CUCU